MPQPLHVFDAYGTLFDVNAAVMRHADALGGRAGRLAELWRTKQLEYSWVLSLIGRPSMSFPSISGAGRPSPMVRISASSLRA